MIFSTKARSPRSGLTVIIILSNDNIVKYFLCFLMIFFQPLVVSTLSTKNGRLIFAPVRLDPIERRTRCHRRGKRQLFKGRGYPSPHPQKQKRLGSKRSIKIVFSGNEWQIGNTRFFPKLLGFLGCLPMLPLFVHTTPYIFVLRRAYKSKVANWQI